MTEKLEVKQALRVFQHVVDRGAKVPGGYRLDGILADPGHDGYTVTLTDGTVTLRIFFHNAYEFEYRRRIDLDAFLDKLDKLDRRSRDAEG